MYCRALPTVALINPMLWYGLLTPALNALGYYFDEFVDADGKLPGKCRALPQNMSAGNYDDGYADYGRLIDVYVRGALYSRNSTWAAAYEPAAARMADYMVRLRQQAVEDRTNTQGLIWGPAEHDRCHDPGEAMICCRFHRFLCVSFANSTATAFCRLLFR